MASAPVSFNSIRTDSMPVSIGRSDAPSPPPWRLRSAVGDEGESILSDAQSSTKTPMGGSWSCSVVGVWKWWRRAWRWAGQRTHLRQKMTMPMVANIDKEPLKKTTEPFCVDTSASGVTMDRMSSRESIMTSRLGPWVMTQGVVVVVGCVFFISDEPSFSVSMGPVMPHPHPQPTQKDKRKRINETRSQLNRTSTRCSWVSFGRKW